MRESEGKAHLSLLFAYKQSGWVLLMVPLMVSVEILILTREGSLIDVYDLYTMREPAVEQHAILFVCFFQSERER